MEAKRETNWYRIKLFPGKGSMVILWYVTGRVGWQGVAPEGSDITMDTIADSFELKWEEIEQGVKSGGDHA